MNDRREDRTLRAEATLLRVPLFALAIKGSAQLDGYEFRHVRRRGERSVESLIRTERDGKRPYPGPLSRRVHMALLAIIAEQGFPFVNPLTWTWRDLCRRMGLPCSGRRDAELKAALRATLGLRLFGLPSPPAPLLSPEAAANGLVLYEACEFCNEPRADGSVPTLNILWLASWYVNSLNAMHTAPLDYGLWKRLEKVGPLASRLYEYLVPSFYQRDLIEVSYDRLALAMPVVVEAKRSHAIRQFSRPLEALREEGLLADAGWSEMKATGRPKLVLRRGPRLEPRGTATPETAAAVATATLPHPAVDRATINEVVATFYALLGKSVRPFRSDPAVARGLIERYGLETVRLRMPDAVKRLKTRFRNAESMGAVLRYFEEAVAEADRVHEENARIEREARQRAADRARGDREHALRRACWEGLAPARREALRAAVLAAYPPLGTDIRLLDAACLNHLTPEDLAPFAVLQGQGQAR